VTHGTLSFYAEEPPDQEDSDPAAALDRGAAAMLTQGKRPDEKGRDLAAAHDRGVAAQLERGKRPDQEDREATAALDHGAAANLERAHFQKLTLISPFPGKVHLRGITVDNWDPQPIPSSSKEVWEGKATLLIDLLGRGDSHRAGGGLEPDVYFSVERFLRAAGKNALADKVYRSLREWEDYEKERSKPEKEGLKPGKERSKPGKERLKPQLYAWLLFWCFLCVLAFGVAIVTRFPPVPRSSDWCTFLGVALGIFGLWSVVSFRPPRKPVVQDKNPRKMARRSNPLAGHSSLIWAVMSAVVSIVVTVVIFRSGLARIVVTIAALTLWVHVGLLLSAAIFFQSPRLLIVNRLMMRIVTGYGTAPQRLVGVWYFLLFMPMAIILHEPRNLALSNPADAVASGQPTAQQAQRGLGGGGSQAPDSTRIRADWGWMAVEATVPIISSLKANNKWEASDSSSTWVGGGDGSAAAAHPGGTAVAIPWSPKTIENRLRLIGWMFWPLVVGGLAAEFVHRRRSSGAS
jgi:hypothetical protein